MPGWLIYLQSLLRDYGLVAALVAMFLFLGMIALNARQERKRLVKELQREEEQR
jgi:hypothetical protein